MNLNFYNRNISKDQEVRANNDFFMNEYNDFLRWAQTKYNAFSFFSIYSQPDPSSRRSLDNDFENLHDYIDVAV